MLLVKTRIEKSPIHGLGLFAAEHIPRGTEVWRFTPEFDLDLDPRLLDRLASPLRERLLHYGYINPRTSRFVLCCDDARFINHSDTPNVLPEFGLDPHGVDIAVQDILPGEEITADYLLIEGARP